jgi:serine/threonine protein kinase
VLLGLPYGVSVDIWSLGCILAELFMSRALFSNKSTAELIAAQVQRTQPAARASHTFSGYGHWALHPAA